MNYYDKEILRILIEAGSDGLSVQHIARNVFNACNSFFTPIDSSEVYKYVQNYLRKMSKDRNSMIESPRRGIYRLNAENKNSQQLYLLLLDDKEEVEKPKPIEDNSLSLF